MSEVKIVDLSYWQNGVSFSKIKELGIYGAIFRITEKGNIKDRSLDSFVSGAKANNIPLIGGYKFLYSLNMDELRQEARIAAQTMNQYPELKGKVLFADAEWSEQLKLGRNTLMKMLAEFKRIVEDEYGLKFGVYCSSGVLDEIVDTSKVNYDLWLASYAFSDDGSIPERLRPKRGQVGWQFSSKFNIGGQNCDMSVFDKNWIDKILSTTSSVPVDVKPEQKEEKKEVVADPILKVLNTAIDEIGYLEKRSNSNLDDKTANAGSGNYTKYWRDVYPQYQAQPWCACFVSWCMMKSFGLETAKKLMKHWPFVYCPTLAGMTSNHTPHRGDVILFYRNGEYCHTGFVESVNGDVVHTIEGNTSGASGIIDNGGGVCRKNYNIYNLSSSTKYFRPDYSIVSGNITPVTPTPSPSSSPSPIPSTSLLKKGSKGAEVRKMQEMLITIGFSCGSYGADSDFGTSTEKALLAFQKYYGLEQDGIYGPMSASRLLVEYQKYPRQVKIVKKAYIREQPSGTSTNLETLKTGVTIEIIGRAFAKNSKPWYTVKTVKGQMGYINGEKVSGI